MNLAYVVPRVIRHFLPEKLTRFLLLRSLLIKPGLETADPAAAVKRYVDVLSASGRAIAGMRVLVFGYGGRFDVGVGLLQMGAAHVVLFDKFAHPDDNHNRHLVGKSLGYVEMRDGRAIPRPGPMNVFDGDLAALARPAGIRGVDLVVSNSVLEHVDNLDAAISELAGLTEKSGLHIHFVDLRDHYFKYPFEMLAYSERDWRRWMNPTSNHNRLRVWDYRRIFESQFREVEIQVLQRDMPAFKGAGERIRPEFISGSVDDDSVTLIMILARLPRS